MTKHIRIHSRSERISFLLARKTLIVTGGLVLCTVLLMIIALGLGSKLLSPLEVIQVLIGQGSPSHTLIIESLRMPRIIVAVLAGAALGVSGLILQGVIRNPLASPDIMGISGGAAFAAVAFITLSAGALSIKWLPAAAFVGAALVAVLIYVLAWKKGVTPIRLVLVGIGISAAAGSLTTLMIVISPVNQASQAYIWMTGTVYAATWDNVWTLLPWVLIGLPAALLYARAVNVQALGDQVAIGLGARLQLHRVMLLIISVALASSAVAIAGAIGFVGLISPHIARVLVGRSYGGLILVTACIGSLMVLGADTMARTAFLPLDIPAGVFTAGVGAPFFIYLLWKNRNL